MKKQHLGCMSYSVIPENWSGTLQLRNMLDGSIENKGVMRYRDLESHHFDVIEKGTFKLARPATLTNEAKEANG